MENALSRTELLLGKEAMKKLKNAKIAVFGIGGVGGYTVEALARSGVGAIDLIDSDTVSVSNINRQIIATVENIGEYKVDAAEKRIHLINPEINVKKYKMFYLPETEKEFKFDEYDYIVDAVDTVSAKISLVVNADKNGVPIISSMGAGNKLDATAFETADIYSTSVCPLARIMRSELRKRGIKSLKVVYSKEKPIFAESCGNEKNGKRIPASIAFVPSVAGLIIAGEVIKDISGIK